MNKNRKNCLITDNTVSLVKAKQKELKVSEIIEKKVWVRDEPGDKNRLLEAGRSHGGTHFIVLDADEILTSNCLSQDLLRNKILALSPGEKLLMHWVQLWRSPFRYRVDPSSWSNQYGDFIFCDAPNASYSSEFIHTSRSPNNNMSGHLYSADSDNIGVLHFQFVNWTNLLIKQAWYRCLEKIRNPNIDIPSLNEKYGLAKREEGLETSTVPAEWYQNYPSFNFNIYSTAKSPYKNEVLKWFEEYSVDFFKGLDIWDIKVFRKYKKLVQKNARQS